MIRRIAAVALVLAVSCGGTGRAGPSASQPRAASSATATPVIDVSDMMGAFPPATFFIVNKGDVSAIALLNHATRYTIATSGKDVQVAAAGPAGRVYVLDQVGEGARLRWFDMNNGSERASSIVADASVVSTGIGHGALAIDDSTGIAYALLRTAGGIVTESFDWFTLKPAGRVFPEMTCPTRVLAGGGRVAVACMSDGLVVVRQGDRTWKPGAPFAFVAVAMLADGTIAAGAEDGRLARFASNGTDGFEYSDTLRSYGAKLIPDGIAANAGCCFYYGIVDPQINDVQVRQLTGGTTLVAFPPTSLPTGGVFVQAPFAYFVIAGRARHIDMQQGFGEVMADLGTGALPGAVANR